MGASVGPDDRGIGAKALPADQPFRDAARQNALKELTEQIAVAEPAMAVLGKRRMIRDVALQAEPAEPAIGEIEMHLLAQPALRANAHDIADDQHPDHQFGIDRGAADGAVEGTKAGADAGQVDEPVDRTKQVISRHMPVEIELIKQCRLHARAFAHHRRILPALREWNQDFTAPATPTFSTVSPLCGHQDKIDGLPSRHFSAPSKELGNSRIRLISLVSFQWCRPSVAHVQFAFRAPRRKPSVVRRSALMLLTMSMDSAADSRVVGNVSRCEMNIRQYQKNTTASSQTVQTGPGDASRSNEDTSPGGSKCFISVATEEAEISILLRHWILQLFPEFSPCFVAVENLRLGDRWLEQIERVLSEVEIFIVIFSQKSLKRHWLHFESGTAWINKRPIIVLTHSDLRKNDLPTPYSAFQGCRIDEADGIDKLLSDLCKHAGRPRVAHLDLDAMHKKMLVAVRGRSSL